ncbi:hypothetical protein RhiirA1_450459 [Rhizophagus irregularis]|uniref:Protein kinase domain-containing protein n=1 Tax=Rhizophagus irregularis TaxID=588596 RepID=A0A2N0SEN2_9GLOM|nr:hypothetical protein RhiirA1_450459 [Rhizophagus irregularis]
MHTLEVLILTNSVSNKSEALNQSRGSDALHLEILPVSNSSSSTNLSLNEKRSHFRQVFSSNKGGRDSLDYVFETIRIVTLIMKWVDSKTSNSINNINNSNNKNIKYNSIHPSVLKSYVYLIKLAKNNTYSSNPRIIEKPDDSLYPFRKPKHDNCDDGDLNSSHNPSKKRNNHSSNNHSNLSNDFKYNRLLSAGENNKKVLECEFCGKTIALKSTDLTKKSKCLDEFLNEVKIYKVLAKLQDIYIPKLLFYSDLANGMSFVMGMTIVGTLLNHHRIDKWLKNKVIMTLKKVHEYNILHNDIHKENILIDEKGYVNQSYEFPICHTEDITTFIKLHLLDINKVTKYKLLQVQIFFKDNDENKSDNENKSNDALLQSESKVSNDVVDIRQFQEFQKNYLVMCNDIKWKLPSGSYVEGNYFNYTKDLPCECPSHSFILDIENGSIMKLFNKEDQEYIKTYNAMADPELEDGLMEYLVTFNETDISKMRDKINAEIDMTPYDPKKTL